jgi:hypothetical protein
MGIFMRSNNRLAGLNKTPARRRFSSVQDRSARLALAFSESISAPARISLWKGTSVADL